MERALMVLAKMRVVDVVVFRGETARNRKETGQFRQERDLLVALVVVVGVVDVVDISFVLLVRVGSLDKGAQGRIGGAKEPYCDSESALEDLASCPKRSVSTRQEDRQGDFSDPIGDLVDVASDGPGGLTRQSDREDPSQGNLQTKHPTKLLRHAENADLEPREDSHEGGGDGPAEPDKKDNRNDSPQVSCDEAHDAPVASVAIGTRSKGKAVCDQCREKRRERNGSEEEGSDRPVLLRGKYRSHQEEDALHRRSEERCDDREEEVHDEIHGQEYVVLYRVVFRNAFTFGEMKFMRKEDDSERAKEDD